MNLDNVFLPADDLAASSEFYQKVLGLPVKFNFADAGMTAFNIGDSEPAIILKDRAKLKLDEVAVWIQVDDARAAYRELSARGVKFLSEPFHINTGWAVELRDPSGNRIGLTDYLPE
ncbi:MAG: VOC family protein [Candidatus Nomurabacteria bacterium]|nr:VOC family protein [Candidatus Nomurabacteria bacterium]